MRDADDLVAVSDAYVELLAEVKREVGGARIRAARTVNLELIGLYWRIGRLILDRQQQHGWGSRVIDRLSTDLRTEFPGVRGFSTRSLVYMRTFAAAYPKAIAQEPLAQLPWSHITVLLDRFRTLSPAIGVRPQTSSMVGLLRFSRITSRPGGTSAWEPRGTISTAP
jgi:predicted nuclease of restriction endonuclease-like (RecB) superfamily